MPLPVPNIYRVAYAMATGSPIYSDVLKKNWTNNPYKILTNRSHLKKRDDMEQNFLLFVYL
jgi:hypothetical protein